MRVFSHQHQERAPSGAPPTEPRGRGGRNSFRVGCGFKAKMNSTPYDCLTPADQELARALVKLVFCRQRIRIEIAGRQWRKLRDATPTHARFVGARFHRTKLTEDERIDLAADMIAVAAWIAEARARKDAAAALQHQASVRQFQRKLAKKLDGSVPPPDISALLAFLLGRQWGDTYFLDLDLTVDGTIVGRL